LSAGQRIVLQTQPALSPGRIDELDLHGKQQLLDLLDVQAQVTGYHACPTCGGTGYQPIPPGHHRHWPPSCPACHRLGVLPDLTIHIGNTELLATNSPAQAPALATGPTTKTAG
jgi:hypothetical protein